MDATSDRPAGGLCHVLFCFQSCDYVSYLLASLYREQDLFFIHCDGRAPDELADYVDAIAARHANIIRLETQDYSWAGFSHVDVCLRAMAAALEHAIPWTHLFFLSEQHLPLTSPAEMQRRLPADKSVVRLTMATAMLPEAQADIRSRFGAVYRELPSVGCFAIGVAERAPRFYDSVFHGSNWLALCRRHCRFLLDADRDGRFDPYRSIVHAEEVAIQSLLAERPDEVDTRDVTLVAAPHLVDNYGLVMTDELFGSSVASDHLFIRKRTRTLSSFVDARIRSQHFRDEMLRPAPPAARRNGSAPKRNHAALAAEIAARLEAGTKASVEVVDPSALEFSCQIHLIARSPAMAAGRSVRVLSQDARSFKVCLVDEATHQTGFPLPAVEAGRLHASIRVKLLGLFGYADRLPLALPDGGFVGLDDDGGVARIVAMAKSLLEEAGVLDGAEVTAPPLEDVRAGRINRLMKLSAGQRYLQIGVGLGETFFAVEAAAKTAVDTGFHFDVDARRTGDESFFSDGSDAFFRRYDGEPFDIIYLDGVHTYEQTSRDFLNSLNLSHEGTIWLFDDTLPNDADAALPDQGECYRRRAAAGNPDASWMGNTYQTILLIGRVMPMMRYRTFEGHGQTVVWKARQAQDINPALPSLAAIGAFSYEALIADRGLLHFDRDEAIYDAILRDHPRR